MGRRRAVGFTLIELLVVIAIIGILAAMLFPVFARAREAARKTQCLANVKNVALALQMYFTDFDALPPKFVNPPDWLKYDTYGHPCGFVTEANEYLRWPVILDEYVKNREVWQCPSAKIPGGASLIIPTADWEEAYTLYGWYPWCMGAWPSGWGGPVTNSWQQGYGIGSGGKLKGTSAGENGAFVQTIGCNDGNGVRGSDGMCGLKSSQVEDAASFVMVADVGAGRTGIPSYNFMYPDACMLCQEGADPAKNTADNCPRVADADDCPWSGVCGLNAAAKSDPNGPLYSASARTRYARHMGGINLGFMDGHAKWYHSEAIAAQLPHNGGCYRGDPYLPGKEGPLTGVDGFSVWFY